MKPYRGGRGIAPLILSFSARWELSGQHHVPVALPPGMNLGTLEQRAGWAPSPSRRSASAKNLWSLLGYATRTVKSIARSPC
jgi:hypothetical protein